MYQYDEYDQALVDERASQFRDQTSRFLSGELSEDQFRPLRLMNGLYIQRHAPMLRIAVPYGLLSSKQLRMLAKITRDYDRGYGHFTTRQNLQINWPSLERVPDILGDLASVQMHAIQTSGNCVRNVTSDPLAGVAKDELEDPRPYCEIIRQWSTLHPEFSYLPRKFKIAVSGSDTDRAATRVHDIGLQLVRNEEGLVGFEVLVGGGLGRTPLIGQVIRPFLLKQDLLSYIEAILRVYNQFGRRDNKYKARVKILLKEMGTDTFRAAVEAEWVTIRDKFVLDQAEIDRVKAHFAPPPYLTFHTAIQTPEPPGADSRAFEQWYRQNTVGHRVPGYRIVYLSLKPLGTPPGDVSAEQLDAIAAMADRYCFSEVRVTHTQNLVMADVPEAALVDLWQELRVWNLATPNIGKATDMICCPGLDYCSLANATSIPVADDIYRRFDSLDYLYDFGDLRINISGCMNGCGHHSVGHIGILGVDKKGEEWYQVTLGGSSSNDAELGERLGPALARAVIGDAVETILKTYADIRLPEESFLQTVRRTGIEPFQVKVYANS